jgi:hypothetical protein
LQFALPNNLQDPISKITRGKWTRSVAQAVEYLFGEGQFKIPFPLRTMKRPMLKRKPFTMKAMS